MPSGRICNYYILPAGIKGDMLAGALLHQQHNVHISSSVGEKCIEKNCSILFLKLNVLHKLNWDINNPLPNVGYCPLTNLIF